MDKQIRVISTPETQPDWPVPPVYKPLWTYYDIEKALDYLDGTDLARKIVHDYDLALAKALRDVWVLQGLINSGAIRELTGTTEA